MVRIKAADDSRFPVIVRIFGCGLLDDQMLDQLVSRVRADGGRLPGPGGFLTEMLKAVLERA